MYPSQHNNKGNKLKKIRLTKTSLAILAIFMELPLVTQAYFDSTAGFQGTNP
jgi:hypothetical protein